MNVNESPNFLFHNSDTDIKGMNINPRALGPRHNINPHPRHIRHRRRCLSPRQHKIPPKFHTTYHRRRHRHHPRCLHRRRHSHRSHRIPKRHNLRPQSFMLFRLIQRLATIIVLEECLGFRAATAVVDRHVSRAVQTALSGFRGSVGWRGCGM